MEQGPTEPHTGRSTFLLSSGGAGGGGYYRVPFGMGPIATENQFPCWTLVARLPYTHGVHAPAGDFSQMHTTGQTLHPRSWRPTHSLTDRSTSCDWPLGRGALNSFVSGRGNSITSCDAPVPVCGTDPPLQSSLLAALRSLWGHCTHIPSASPSPQRATSAITPC